MRPYDERSIERFKTLIANRGLTQTELAERIGIPQPTLSQIVCGRRKLLFDEAYLIGEALQVDLEDLARITGHVPA